MDISFAIHRIACTSEPRAIVANIDHNIEDTIKSKKNHIPSSISSNTSSTISNSITEEFNKNVESRNTLRKMQQTRQLEDSRTVWYNYIQQFENLVNKSINYQYKKSILQIIGVCKNRLDSLAPETVDSLETLKFNIKDIDVSNSSSEQVYTLMRSDNAKKLKYIVETYIPILEKLKLLFSENNLKSLIELGIEAENVSIITAKDGWCQLSCWFIIIQDLIGLIILHNSLLNLSTTDNDTNNQLLINALNNSNKKNMNMSYIIKSFSKSYRFSKNIHLQRSKLFSVKEINEEFLSDYNNVNVIDDQLNNKEDISDTDAILSSTTDMVPIEKEYLNIVDDMLILVENILWDLIYCPSNLDY